MRTSVGLLTVLAFAWVTPPLQAAATSRPGSPRTQVILIGTIHGGHSTNMNYSGDRLRDLIVALKPAAILVELPPTISGRPMIKDGRCEEFGGNETKACNLAADALGVDVIAYDRDRRNEFYRETDYFPRQSSANGRCNDWLESESRKSKDSPHVRVLLLLRDAVGRQRKIDAGSGPEKINTQAYDVLIATKHQIMHHAIPTVLAAAGELELAGEFRFFADEWQVRNEAMAVNIVKAARQFEGKRLVVITGSEHRYMLRELLAKALEVQLSEFYDVAGYTGTRPAE